MSCPRCGSEETEKTREGRLKAAHVATHLGLHQVKHMAHANPLFGLIGFATVGLAHVVLERLLTTGLKCKNCSHKYC